MSVLLNTFRPKQVNEEHYNQKMKFWKELIEDYCLFKGTAKVNVAELKQVFKRKGTVPYCLQTVFDEMTAEGNLINKETFMSPPKSLTGWALDSLLVKPLSWGFGKIKEKIVSPTQDEQTLFVVKSAIAAQSKLLLEHIRNRHSYNNIISMDDLMGGVDELDGLNGDGILLVLQHLSTEEKKVYIEENKTESEHHHKILLKFSEPHQQAKPITDIERSIYNLEQTEKFLLKTIDKKEHDLNEVLKQVKDNLKDGKKQMAKTYLRKKHLMETDLIKTINVLDNVQTMLMRVRASNSDKEIVNTYKMGSEAIKKAFSDAGVNLENVHDIIEDMQDVYADQEDFQAAISEPLRGLREVDDSELEKELNDLLNSNENDKGTNNTGGQAKPTETDLLDRELEERLKRLRSDFTHLDDPTVPKNTRAGLLNLWKKTFHVT